MPTYSISLTFTSTAKNDDRAQQLAERIGAYVHQEKMASDYAVIDVELLDDEEEIVEELDFDEDDE